MLDARSNEGWRMWRTILLLGIAGMLLLACGADGGSADAIADGRVCQRDAKGEKVAGSPATYVRGRTELRGCILDLHGKGIADATTWVDVARSDVTAITAAGNLSGEGGRYTDANIYQPGWYTVTVAAYGYEPVTKRVLIREGWTAVLDWVLRRDSRVKLTVLPTLTE